ncbi:MAG: OmpH family outer membrane protein [Alphaproteobacteria bacterium]
MKIFVKAVLTAAAFAILALPGHAPAMEPTTVAVVDVQKLLNESKAGKNIHEQLEAHKAKFLTDISQQEQKLRDDEKALTDKRATLPAEEFAEKAKTFESELTETRRKAQERKRAIEDAAAKSMGTLRNEILKVVQKISDEEGYGLVINRQNVVISSKDMDITDKALANLDQAISQISLEIADK